MIHIVCHEFLKIYSIVLKHMYIFYTLYSRVVYFMSIKSN